MTDTIKPDAAAVPVVPTKITAKLDGKVREFDLSKPEDVQAAQHAIELGYFNEKQTNKVKEIEAKTAATVAALEQEAAIGREWKDFRARQPFSAELMGTLMTAFGEGRLDPAKVRDAITAGQQGDTTQLEAQARAASGDPQARALLQNVVAELQAVRAEVGSVKSEQTKRDLDAAISNTVAGIDFLKGLPATQASVSRRTRELVSQGMGVDLAASQATQEVRDLLNEKANAERARLQEQTQLATVRPNAGVPGLAGFVPKTAVDPKAAPRVQRQQRLAAGVEKFRAIREGLAGGPAQ